MENSEFEKAIVLNVVDLLHYIPHSVEVRSIFRRTTGDINALAFDTGQLLEGKISPFDNFILIIEGKAQIEIDDKLNILETGQSIIIPAHSHNSTKALVRLKIISVIIKSGYEEVSL